MDYVKAYVFPGILVKAYEGLLLEGLIGFFFIRLCKFFCFHIGKRSRSQLMMGFPFDTLKLTSRFVGESNSIYHLIKDTIFLFLFPTPPPTPKRMFNFGFVLPPSQKEGKRLSCLLPELYKKFIFSKYCSPSAI